MTFELFMVLFVILEFITPLLVEGIKKFLDALKRPYNSTVVALVVAIVASFTCGIFFYLQNGIPITALNCLYVVFLMISNWLGSTLGYDKVKETLKKLPK